MTVQNISDEVVEGESLDNISEESDDDYPESLDNILSVHSSPIPTKGIRIGDFYLETDGSQKVWHKKKQVLLSKKEYDVLSCFFMNPGMTISPLEIITFIEPQMNILDTDMQSVKVYIHKLKNKLPPLKDKIVSLHQRGYLFMLPENTEYLHAYESNQGSITINHLQKIAYKDGKILPLANTEFSILSGLILADGETVEQPNLLPPTSISYGLSRQEAGDIVKVQVHRLKGILGDGGTSILSCPKEGYRIICSDKGFNVGLTIASKA